MSTGPATDHPSAHEVDPLAGTVADVMHPGIVSCSQSATAADIALIMSACRVHCVAVLGLAQDGDHNPVIWGIVSDLDLLRATTDPGTEDSAAALARQPVITVRSTMSLREAARAMVDYKVQHVLVVEPEELAPVGVLSTLDIAGQLADRRS